MNQVPNWPFPSSGISPATYRSLKRGELVSKILECEDAKRDKYCQELVDLLVSQNYIRHKYLLQSVSDHGSSVSINYAHGVALRVWNDGSVKTYW